MRRGQCLSPLNAPVLRAMVTHYLFRGYRIFGGAQSGGGETPGERSGFLKTFLQSQNIIVF